MKTSLAWFIYITLSIFYTIMSLSVITLETLYWECVIYLVEVSKALDMSLYDIYTIVFVFLVPYTVVLSIITIIFKLIRRFF
jgi:hypothetical protein